MDNNKLWLQNQGYKIDELLSRIQMLEKNQSQIIPLLQEEKEIKKTEELKSKKRKILVMELAQSNSIPETRKNQILQDLNKLS